MKDATKCLHSGYTPKNTEPRVVPIVQSTTDEVQKAPELFEEIKIICDNSDERGQFWLTGSQSKKLVKKAGDSLANVIKLR